MEDQGGSGYAPRSPDLSAYHAGATQQSAPSHLSNSYYMQQPPPFQSEYLSAPPQPHFFQNQYNAPPVQPFQNQESPFGQDFSLGGQPPPDAHQAMMQAQTDQPPAAGEAPKTGRGRGRKPKPKPEVEVCSKPAPGVEEGIEVKTKFPVARIKRIMQADEDVGKVAQVTPTAVSKALELFMISLVTKAATVARDKSAKKVTAAHLKQAVELDEQFDFLNDIVSKVPDQPTKRAAGSDSEGEGEGGKRKKGRKKAKQEDDDF